MQFMSLVKFFLICPILFCAQAIYAQTDSSSYIVTYLEVDPITIEESIELLGQISELSSDLQENIFYIVLQRIGRPNHFAIIERWDSNSSMNNHLRSSVKLDFQKNITPFLYSPYDERIHSALDINDVIKENAKTNDIVYGVTHIDIVPTSLDTGIKIIKDLVTDSRNDDGNIFFDVLTQESRRNHMTLIESWDNARNQTSHSLQEHSSSFRSLLLPISGSLYDERIYKKIW